MQTYQPILPFQSSKLFQQFNGGGHPKAASATAKVADETEAKRLLQRLVNELIDKGLDEQLTVGDFMQSPGELPPLTLVLIHMVAKLKMNLYIYNVISSISQANNDRETSRRFVR